MNKEIKISKEDDDEGAGADPSTFNPDEILTNAKVEEFQELIDPVAPPESYLMSKSMWPE